MTTHHPVLAPLAFGSAAELAATVGNASFWAPYGAAVLARHALAPASAWTAPASGSFPTLRTGNGRIVKFYGPFLDGADCAATEAATLTALSANRRASHGGTGQAGRASHPSHPSDTGVVVPELEARGALFPGCAPDWPWPYLVMSEVAGEALFAVRTAPPPGGGLDAVAFFAGRALAEIWRCPVPADGGPRLAPSWGPFVALLARRRAEAVAGHRAAGRLSPRLCARLDRWLPTADQLVETSRPPTLLHGDLHGDHVLIERAPTGGWEGRGIIDLSDAIAGDPAYDLVALHLDGFGGRRDLLGAAVAGLDAAGAGHLVDVDPKRLLALSLLHEFDPFERWSGMPAAWLASVEDPDELADALWSLERRR